MNKSNSCPSYMMLFSLKIRESIYQVTMFRFTPIDNYHPQKVRLLVTLYVLQRCSGNC